MSKKKLLIGTAAGLAAVSSCQADIDHLSEIFKDQTSTKYESRILDKLVEDSSSQKASNILESFSDSEDFDEEGGWDAFKVWGKRF